MHIREKLSSVSNGDATSSNVPNILEAEHNATARLFDIRSALSENSWVGSSEAERSDRTFTLHAQKRRHITSVTEPD